MDLFNCIVINSRCEFTKKMFYTTMLLLRMTLQRNGFISILNKTINKYNSYNNSVFNFRLHWNEYHSIHLTGWHTAVWHEQAVDNAKNPHLPANSIKKERVLGLGFFVGGFYFSFLNYGLAEGTTLHRAPYLVFPRLLYMVKATLAEFPCQKFWPKEGLRDLK